MRYKEAKITAAESSMIKRNIHLVLQEQHRIMQENEVVIAVGEPFHLFPSPLYENILLAIDKWYQ